MSQRTVLHPGQTLPIVKDTGSEVRPSGWQARHYPYWHIEQGIGRIIAYQGNPRGWSVSVNSLSPAAVATVGLSTDALPALEPLDECRLCYQTRPDAPLWIYHFAVSLEPVGLQDIRPNTIATAPAAPTAVPAVSLSIAPLPEAPAAVPDDLWIPRIFHRIWLGPKPLPDYAVEYGAGWLRHHPNWEIRLWTEDNLPEMVNRKRFDAGAGHYGFQADVLRLEIMRQYGGIYLDTDFECQQNLEPLLRGLRAFAGYYEPEAHTFKTSFEQAILGSCPYHALFERAVLEHEPWMQEHEHAGRIMQASSWYLAEKIRQVYGSFIDGIPKGRHAPLVLGDFALFPSRYFYPYHWTQLEHLAHLDYPDAYAIHRIRGSWLAMES